MFAFIRVVILVKFVWLNPCLLFLSFCLVIFCFRNVLSGKIGERGQIAAPLVVETQPEADGGAV